MTIAVLCILGIATVGCIIGAVQESKEPDNLYMRVYVILGVIVGLLLVIGGFISYFTHWF